MTHGFRLTGTTRDLATLHALSDGAPPELMKAPWVEITAPGEKGLVVASPKLDAKHASALAARGVPVVSVHSRGSTCTFEPLAGGDKITWKNAVGRNCSTLLEALRPVRSAGEPLADEACFWVTPNTPGAQRLLERLLLLGRDDAAIAQWEDAGRVVLAVQVSRPPLYLLMRSRDEEEGVQAFARFPESNLWVQWGFQHPLPLLGAKALQIEDRSAFVEASGRWRYAPSRWNVKSIYDAIAPELTAQRTDLKPAQGEYRHTIHLRLAAGQDLSPELWLLDMEQFLGLEPMLEGSTPEEIARFTVGRMAGGEPFETRYIVREVLRPNVPRLGTRVTDLTGAKGFVRAPGTDNLFLPLGRRLLPVMRRDELRKLLGLDRAKAVLLDEDEDGMRIISLTDIDETPLSRWVDYVATDRRLELDRLLETSVFELPEVIVEKPVRKEKEDTAEEKRREPPPAPKEVRVKPAARKEEEVKAPAATEDAAQAAAEAALREEVRVLEQSVAEGGCDTGETWYELGWRKAKLRQYDDAASCLEASLFHGNKREAAASRALVDARAKLVTVKGTQEELVDFAVRGVLSPSEASYLGARVLELALRNDPTLDTVAQPVLKTFAEGETPVSRRLAWLVLASCYLRSKDTLGLTRAKEAVLGRINDRGLDESFDLPSFVRFVLALGGGSDGNPVNETTRGQQLAVLDSLWKIAGEKMIRDLDPMSMYTRLTFAMGYTRLGMGARARDLVVPLEAELSVHEAPNQVLFKLYTARMAHAATRGADDAWKREVESILSSVKESRVKDRVEWLRKRSLWLRTGTGEETTPYIRGPFERLIAESEKDPTRLGTAVHTVFTPGSRAIEGLRVYDYEATQVIERATRAALRTGNDAIIAEVLAAATAHLGAINIPGHRAVAIGACIRAAATVNDAAAVDALLDQIVAIAGAPNVPSVRDLLFAVQPGLAALRRVGSASAAQRLLEALIPVARKGGREGLRLQAALADGFLQLRETKRGDELIDTTITETLTATLDHPGRYEAGAAVLSALTHWPISTRGPRCQQVFAGIDEFRDTFTTKQFYETHKVLILERLIDAVTDDVTFRTDRVQGFLDREEQAIRRRILRDWRDACGR